MTAAPPVRLDWDDIQGGVLRGYGFDHAHHLILTVTDPAAARRWLQQLLPEVTPATPWDTRPALTLNLALTHRGLAALGVGERSLASFPADFREGMRARVAHTGDSGTDGPARWEPAGMHHPDAHLLVMVHATAAEAGETRSLLLASEASDNGLDLLASERLATLAPPPGAPRAWRNREHFGFVDGISQPAVEGALPPTVVPGNGTPLARTGWRPVRAGEFVLGYPDEEEQVPPLPEPEALARNGSYLVYRKLAQDVAGFRRLVGEIARRHDLAPREVEAKLVGRAADGTPLLPGAATGVAPGAVAGGVRDDPAPSGDRAALNDFRYAGDRRGAACPLGSHIRRANPRDAFGLAPELVSRHRLLRRGMPYGPPLPPETTADDGTARGLLFLAYCASISRQFEFVQRAWLNDGNAFGAGYTPDPVAGHGPAPRRFVLEAGGHGPVLVADLPRVVRLLGGDYLFQPGLRGLHAIATGG